LDRLEPGFGLEFLCLSESYGLAEDFEFIDMVPVPVPVQRYDRSMGFWVPDEEPQ
jgi:hypothetical protein